MARRVDVDTFQALVSAAHLRPMNSSLRLAPAAAAGKPAAQRHFRPDGTLAGSSPVLASGAVRPAPAAAAACPSAAAPDAALRSGARFVRAWRAAPPAGRLDLLRHAVAAGALPRQLRQELSSRQVDEMVACLADHLAADGAAAGAPKDGVLAEQGTPGAAAAGAAAAAPVLVPRQLAAAALQAVTAASSYAVAEAGLALQARQRLTGLRAALE